MLGLRQDAQHILARQFELAKLDEAKEGAVIQVVDPAVPPDKKSFPPRALIIIGGTVLGFILSIPLALVQAALSHIRSDPETIEKIAPLRRAMSWRKPIPS